MIFAKPYFSSRDADGAVGIQFDVVPYGIPRVETWYHHSLRYCGNLHRRMRTTGSQYQPLFTTLSSSLVMNVRHV